MPTTTGLATSFINFSRPGASGGGATVTDRDGKIKWAGHNLLSNSESFDAWTNTNTTVIANSTVAPNGTTTADTVTASATNLSSSRFQNVSLAVGTYTLLFFARAGTATELGTGAFSGSFASASGQIVSGPGSVSGSTNIDVTGLSTTEWTQVRVTLTIATAATYSILFYPDRGAASGKSVILWGAHLYRSDLGGMQLNPSMPAGMQSYYPTTPRNLLGFTEDFSNAAWVKTQIAAFGSGSISNAIVAPNGLQTADKIVASAAAGYHAVRQFVTVTTAPYVFSFYAKAAEYSLCYVTDIINAQFRVAFNLATGAVVAGTTGGGNYVSSAITSVGDGWYRCSISLSGMASNPTFALIGYPSSGATLDAYGLQYTGDGTSGIYLWGAQLSDSASLDTYVPQYGAAVTSAAYYAPRLDFDGATLAAKGLLVEELRTNIVLHSHAFDNAAWIKGGLAATPVVADAIASPSGAVDADKLVEGTTTSSHGVYPTSGYTTTSGQNVVFSVFAKAAERNILIVDAYFGSSAFTYFNLSTGTIGTNAAGNTASIQSVGNGWYRCTVVRTSTNSAANSTFLGLYMTSTDNVNVYAGNGTSGLYVWGAQVESNASFATSYIPTGSATATRAADVASVSTGAFPYSASEGTLVANVDVLSVANANAATLWSLYLDGNNSIRSWIWDGAKTTPRGTVRTSGTDVADIAVGTIAANSAFKTGLAFKADDIAFTTNGASPTPDTTGALPSGLNDMRIGALGTSQYLNGHIRQITYLPRRISNAELIARSA